MTKSIAIYLALLLACTGCAATTPDAQLQEQAQLVETGVFIATAVVLEERVSSAERPIVADTIALIAAEVEGMTDDDDFALDAAEALALAYIDRMEASWTIYVREVVRLAFDRVRLRLDQVDLPELEPARVLLQAAARGARRAAQAVGEEGEGESG